MPQILHEYFFVAVMSIFKKQVASGEKHDEELFEEIGERCEEESRANGDKPG